MKLIYVLNKKKTHHNGFLLGVGNMAKNLISRYEYFISR